MSKREESPRKKNAFKTCQPLPPTHYAEVLGKPALEDMSGASLDVGDAAARTGDDGAWRTGRQRFFPGTPLRSWALVSLTGRCDVRMLDDLARQLMTKGRDHHGMVIDKPQAGRSRGGRHQPGETSWGSFYSAVERDSTCFFVFFSLTALSSATALRNLICIALHLHVDCCSRRALYERMSPAQRPPRLSPHPLVSCSFLRAHAPTLR